MCRCVTHSFKVSVKQSTVKYTSDKDINYVVNSIMNLEKVRLINLPENPCKI